MSEASKLSEVIDFMAKLNKSKLSAVERVKVLKQFLIDSENKDSDKIHKSAKDEIQASLDMAHFEATTPW